MARIKEFMDLCELGDAASLLAAGWTQVSEVGSGTSGVTATPYHDTQGNGGSYSLYANAPYNDWVTPTAASPVATFYARFHHQVNGFNLAAGDFSATAPFFRWRHGTTVLGYLAYNNTGHLVLWRGDNVQLGSTSSVALATSTWATIEVGITIGNSGAAYEVRVNDQTVISGTGDTQPGSDTTVDNLVFLSGNAVVFTGYTNYFDDIAVDDSTWVKESLITALFPSGAGNTTELTPSGGANYTTVDERPPSDADYNSTAVANKKDTYAHTSLPGAASTVNCVMPVARVNRDGTTIEHAYLVVRSNGADYEGSSHLLGISPTIITDLREVDPDTSLAWSVARVNASEVGIRFDT